MKNDHPIFFRRNQRYQFWSIPALLLLATTAASDMTVSNTITANSFSGDGSALTNLPADLIYTKTTLVGPVGSASDNGAVLRDALNNLKSSDPHLLKIEPGVYDLGNTGLVMFEYVDIEGSGEGISKITSTDCGGTFPDLNGTVRGANHSEMRFLTVENTGSGAECAAIVNNTAASRILHVSALTSGDGDIKYGIFNREASPSIVQSTARVSGTGNKHYGIYNFSASPEIMQTDTSATGGTENYGVYNVFSAPTIIQTTASAVGGDFSYGIYNNTSFTFFPTITQTTATASDAAENFGIYNKSAATIRFTTALATGGGNDTGIYNHSSAPIMSSVVAIAKEGSGTRYGMRNLNSVRTQNIDRSVFEGATRSIKNDAGYTVNLSASKLVGTINSSGTFNCVGVTLDVGAGYVAANATCTAP